MAYAAPPPSPQEDAPPVIVQPGAPGRPGKILSAADAARIPALRPPSQADIEFMQGMIIHHSQAIEMVDLLITRTTTKALQTLGKRITISQIDEIEYMKQWLRERNQQPVSAGGGSGHMGGSMARNASDDVALMPGMLTPNQMKALARAFGPAFDQLFLTGMIQHHTGALEMVDDLFATPGAGQEATLFDFATDVENTQRAEIEIMRNMLPKPAPKKVKK